MKLPEKTIIYFNIGLVKEYVDTSYGTSVKNHGNQESKRGFQTGLMSIYDFSLLQLVYIKNHRLFQKV